MAHYIISYVNFFIYNVLSSNKQMYFVLGPEMEILWFGTPDAVKKVSFYFFS